MTQRRSLKAAYTSMLEDLQEFGFVIAPPRTSRNLIRLARFLRLDVRLTPVREDLDRVELEGVPPCAR